MTNLRTDEMSFFRSLTKIGTDENKTIYSTNIKYINITDLQIESKCWKAILLSCCLVYEIYWWILRNVYSKEKKVYIGIHFSPALCCEML